MTQQIALQQLVTFYQTLDSTRLTMLAEIYHPDVRLSDPVGEHQGLAVVEQYFASLLKNMRYCRFVVTLTREFDSDALLLWRMEYAHPSLQGGADQTLEGSSYLQFREGKVVFQRDYYDMGAMLYEKLPLLGSVIGLVKKRLQP
ncbi:MAG TPA: nuclear transport factor 2 family protein [Erwinia persicina]|uniref:Nuclear transport factor 2 family protein n=1 Tax=Erwinia persicina TaxID=55211 RepID=A0A354DQJ2_9GAMM|nr:nuclear transport factor 2 family protein [Erwinia persicina]AXU95822.1 nuclear transport factor 2 family protein [Erwinia persicina]MBC3945472.1 nuclear transport factor 2 family protein [Erwinia persicina]MBD8107344.1 nuclear transport factor 2 family protein [Erwinia persicina]MBD8210436.1 nuclear transport factor 2 family protein [Erwinia persicina]MCQ4093040.1 nuclear transport factor 2 family protein [Erwinia persicina]